MKMKNLVLAASAVLSLAAQGATQAADLPAKAPIYAPQPAPIYNWTGIYFGAHVGAGWITGNWNATNFTNLGPLRLGEGSGSGFLGGAQGGINYQIGAMVFGVEGDISWAQISGDTCNTISAVVHCNSQADRVATLAGRFGIAADRSLFYLKGGVAWLRSTQLLDLTLAQATLSDSKRGWTAGAGVEYALTRNWSAKLEYDFMDFGTSQFTFDFPIASTIVATDIKQRLQTVTFGLNYRFDWGGSGGASY
jgi:outer membrane immunogenic protein